MRHVLEDLVSAAGRKLEDYLTLLPIEPLTRYFYPDGTVFDVSANSTAMSDRITAFDERDVEGYLAYLAYAARIHDITGPVFIYDNPPTPRSFARIPPWDWLKADPLRTMDTAIRAHVRSPHLRQLLGRFATYVGGSPYHAPATLNVIAHVELNGGVWYPQGGIYKIAEALGRLALELGVEICVGTGIRGIHVENGRASGVVLDDERSSLIKADAVIANLDVTTVYQRLLPPLPSISRRLRQLQQYEASCSGFILMLGVKGSHPELAHHNIFFSGDYRAEFQSIFEEGKPPSDPTIYVAITSKSDPTHAPDGHENWFVLVNTPPLNEYYNWAENASAYRNLILRQFATFGLDIREDIIIEHMMTPHDLEASTGAYRGALYGPSPNSRWTAFRRPHNRCKEVRGLYFAGGTTHPGGGVPMVALSGKVAASLLLQDFEQA
jgi:phytoene desaturase